MKLFCNKDKEHNVVKYSVGFKFVKNHILKYQYGVGNVFYILPIENTLHVHYASGAYISENLYNEK